MERVKSLRPMKVEFKHLGLILLVFMGSSPHMTMAMSNILSFDPSNSRTRINSTFDISIVPSGEHQYHGATATLDNANTLWLIPDPSETNNHNLSGGRIVSKESIEFSSHTTGAIVSFNTSFSFRIVTQSNESGEGMAFFIAQDKTFPHSSAGAYLGLSNGTLMENTSFPGHKFFAVEFDISQSPQFDDPSSSHVGIDINSLQSIQTLDTSGIAGLSLLRNFSFQAWIEFNASTSLVQVWLMNYEESTDYANSLDRKDQSPVLQASIDPSVFQDTSMWWVGITATSGSTLHTDDTKPSGYAIYSWYFSTFDEAQSTDISLLLKSSNPPNHKDLGLILGISFPLAFLIIFIGYFTIVYKNGGGALYRNLRPKKSQLCAAYEEANSDMQQFSYNVLKRATHNFSDKMLLGEGGFSKVYKGMLPNDECPTSSRPGLVAIKKLKENVKEGGEATFASEMRIISNIRHRNLLRLRGWSCEKGKALLVYEFADNGSLEKLLYAKDKMNGESVVLTSERRWKILVGVATALEYLHEGLGECVIHRDVKAANVLLSKDWEPMLGDFGLARLVSRDKLGATMTAVGTMGYMAPELVYTGRATEKADVYSFGILALEIACGRRVLDFNLGPEEMNLLDWIWTLYKNDKLMDSLDPHMLQFDAHSIHDEFGKVMTMWRGVIHVALNCCHPQTEHRPSMREVRHILTEGYVLPLPASRPNQWMNNDTAPTLDFTSNPPTRDGSSSFRRSL